ncbi:MAG: nucleotidyltransferase domain-containing protein, partial [Candidatus Aenigmarchaeota archaeon]|nr:nucleotidyltransferase domain-containing protein [Candidatus Aenigmarchaeota archaeon]
QKTVTKTVKKYGNSGGVYLPSSWVGGEVEVSLTHRPPKPEIDLPLAFADRMEHIISILIYGSYARNDQTGESDIDVIVVTDAHAKDMKIPAQLKGMNYDIRIMNREELKKAVEGDALFNKSLENSRAIFNGSFLDELKPPKTRKNLEGRISLAKSSLEITKSIFEMGGDNAALVYPVIMRVKEMLLIKCILENREFSLKLLEDTMRKKGVSKSDFRKLIGVYRAVRDGKKPVKYEFGEQVFRKLFELLGGLIDDAEKKEKA